MNKSPEAGWYPNPEAAHEVRWWDGEQWTDHVERNPMAVPAGPPPPAGPPGVPQYLAGTQPLVGQNRPIGQWLNETFSLIGSRIGHIFTLAVVLGLVPNLVHAAALYTTFREARLFLPANNGDPVFEGVSSTGLLTITATMIVTMLLGLVLWAAIGRQIQLERTGEPEIWSASLGPAFARVLRVFGVQLGLWLLLIVGLAVMIILSVAVDPGTLLLTIPLFIGGAIYLGVRLALAVTAATVGPRGTSSFSNSFRLTKGRFGMMFGRLMVLAILLFMGSLILSVLTQVILGAFQGGGLADPIIMDSRVDQTIEWETFFGTNPAAFFLSTVLSGLGNSLLLGLVLGGLVVLYGDLGGEVADDLQQSDSV